MHRPTWRQYRECGEKTSQTQEQYQPHAKGVRAGEASDETPPGPSPARTCRPDAGALDAGLGPGRWVLATQAACKGKAQRCTP